METNHRNLLREAFCNVAENLAFMFGDLAEEDEFPPPPAECVEAHMSFVGPLAGTLTMAVPAEMCPEIAANVLGVEPDHDLVSAKPYDALKELLNVTCGHVLTGLAGEEPVFDLSVPEVAEIDAAQWEALRTAPGAAAFLVDDNPVLLRLVLRG